MPAAPSRRQAKPATRKPASEAKRRHVSSITPELAFLLSLTEMVDDHFRLEAPLARSSGRGDGGEGLCLSCMNAFAGRTVHGTSSELRYHSCMLCRAGSDIESSKAQTAMSGRLQDKVAIVIGAGSVGPGWGNGRAMAFR